MPRLISVVYLYIGITILFSESEQIISPSYFCSFVEQDMAFKNSARRSSFVDTHTMGPKTLAQVRNKMVCVTTFNCPLNLTYHFPISLV